MCTAVRVRAGRANARRQRGQWADRLCFDIRTQRAKRARIRHLPKALPLHIQHRGASDLQSGEIGLACNAHPRAQARPRAAGSAGSDLARGPAPSSLRGPRTSDLPRGSTQASRDSPEGTRKPASRTPPCGTPIGCMSHSVAEAGWRVVSVSHPPPTAHPWSSCSTSYLSSRSSSPPSSYSSSHLSS